MYFTLLVFASLLATARGKLGGHQQDKENPWVVTTAELPLSQGHPKYMPTLSNGQLAIRVFGQTLRQNCLYNGRDWTSHRARIPGYANYHLALESNETIYTLRFDQAVFEKTVKGDHFSVKQQILVHRHFTRSIFNFITYESELNRNDVIYIGVDLDAGPNSLDLNFGPKHILKLRSNLLHISEVNYMCGETKQVENRQFQKEKLQVCIAWTEPNGFIVTGQDEKIVRTYLTIVDDSIEGILEEIDHVIKHSAEDIVKKHINAWDDIWTAGHVSIKGAFDLEQTILASQFYLLSYLPFPQLSARALPPFCGLSPGGLAYGGPMTNYEGHSFWDTEVWMFPPILLLHPGAAKELLNYRLARLDAAKDYAARTGWSGVRFPWESALTGVEVCPAIAATTRDNEQHITADVSFAIRQYLAVTGDVEWFVQKIGNNSGCDVVRGIAEFWVGRTEFNNATGNYDIKNVMGPDEDHENVDNNAFTNTVASLAIKLAHYLGEKSICERIPDEWIQVAESIVIPYDSEKDYHPEFSGYSPGTIVKQADAVLLGFPLMLNMSLSTRQNDLRIYEKVVRETGPAMTWSMHAIGHLEIGESDQGELYFNRSYQPHVTKPFFIWTENKQPNFGAVNFITGMGGFLQIVFHGYFGLRVCLDKIIVNPQLPRKSESMVISGLDFHGNLITMSAGRNQTNIRILRLRKPMELIKKNKVYLIDKIENIQVGSGPFELRPLNW
eukprot:GFUD01064882.1.p1 GENE.GFUD01064882.1~~GFUD01064882.1.p1  ORF type:complete len:726 (-),score=100.02 GFUD01064882.1:44-2221(-)